MKPHYKTSPTIRKTSRRPTRSEMLTLRVTPELRSRLEAAASFFQISASDLVRLAIERQITPAIPH